MTAVRCLSARYKTVFMALSQKVTALHPESVQESVTTAGPGKKAAVTSLVAATGMRTITENAVESGTAIARGTGTETVRERGKGNTDIVKRKTNEAQGRMEGIGGTTFLATTSPPCMTGQDNLPPAPLPPPSPLVLHPSFCLLILFA